MDWQEAFALCALDSDKLIERLQHEDGAVRGIAAEELGRRKEVLAVEGLIAVLQRDSETIWDGANSAAKALAEIGDERAIDPLIGALEKPLVRGAAIEALSRLHNDKAIEALIQLFEVERHSSLATVLGNIGDKRAVEPLIRAMSDGKPDVRFYVARALGKIGDPRAIEVLEWAKANDITPIADRKSLRGKSVSDVAAKALEKIAANS